MSSGQKACAEDREEFQWGETLKRFRTHHELEVISTIERSIDELKRFIESDPSLTKKQWAKLEYVLKGLKNLV